MWVTVTLRMQMLNRVVLTLCVTLHHTFLSFVGHILHCYNRVYFPIIKTEVDCGEPCPIVNAERTDNGTTEFGDVITYRCLSGYEHTGGNLTRTCTENRTYTGNPPVCTGEGMGTHQSAQVRTWVPTSLHR